MNRQSVDRRAAHCSIFMITRQGQAAAPCLRIVSGSESMNRHYVSRKAKASLTRAK